MKAILKKRAYNQKFQEMDEELKNFRSCEFFRSLRLHYGMLPELNNIDNFARRRILAKLLLDCPGSIIERRNRSKVCASCETVLEMDVFEHKILECRSLEIARAKAMRKDWWSRFSNELGDSRALRKLMVKEVLEIIIFFMG